MQRLPLARRVSTALMLSDVLSRHKGSGLYDSLSRKEVDVYVRIDDRLIHGQVVTAWLKELKSKGILVVDDMAAKNPILSKTLSLACPKGVSLSIASTSDACSHLAEWGPDALIICKLPVTARSLFAELPNEDWTICVGNVSGGAGRTAYSKSVHLDDENYAAVLELNSYDNVSIFMQTTPGDARSFF